MANTFASNFGESAALATWFSSVGGGWATSAGNYSTKLGWANGNGNSVSNNAAAQGTMVLSVAAGAEYYIHFRANWGAHGGKMFSVRETGTEHVRLLWNADGTFSLQQGSGTALGTSVAAFTSGSVDIQLHLKISDTVGVAELRLQGNTSNDVAFSGDTRNGGAVGTINELAWVPISTAVADFSDLTINDTTGSAETSWTGAVRVVLAVPTAAGADGTAWTPNASTNLSRITDTIPGSNDGDTTYNESSTATQKDFYTWGSSAFTGLSPSLIHYVRTKYFARAADGGSHTMRSFAKSTSVVNGATITLGATFALFEDLFVADPSTSAAWASFAAISAAEFGYELVS